MEFWAMIEFACPTLLGSLNTFCNMFEKPITRSRDISCSLEEKELGEIRAQELHNLTSKFVLRRTSDLLKKYLPPKIEITLFCQMTMIQKQIYQALINCKVFKQLLSSTSSNKRTGIQSALVLISLLKHCANYIGLLLDKCQNEIELLPILTLFQATNEYQQDVMNDLHIHWSGKLLILSKMLIYIKNQNQQATTTIQKTVIVSNYQSCLNIIAKLCNSLSLQYYRLDGSTASNKRQKMVDNFNAIHNTTYYLFIII